MRCGLCGYDLNPDEAESTCASCPMGKGCHLVRCPRCGYEMPPEARLVKWIRKLRQRAKTRSAQAFPGSDGRTTIDGRVSKANKGEALTYEAK